MPKKYICTERAHYMCPNMHFAIAIKVDSILDKDKLTQSVKKLRKAHPLLSSVISEDEDGRAFYEYKADTEVPIIYKEIKADWLSDYKEVTGCGWNLRRDCMLKVIAYEDDGYTFLVLAAHHLLCDGIALLQFAEELAKVYSDTTASPVIPTYEDRIIESQDDFNGRMKAPFMIKCIASSANKKWRTERRKLTYDYYREYELKADIGGKYSILTNTVENDELSEIIRCCKEAGVTVNDYLLAKMMEEEKTCTVLAGANIRKYYGNYEPGSLGNYSSAYSVKAKPTGDVYSTAKNVSKAMGKIKDNPHHELLTLALYNELDSNLLDAAAITALGGYESQAALFVGDRLLGFKSPKNCTITNLGRVESDIIKEMFFVPPFSPSVRVITGVVTLGGVMNTITIRRRDL